MGKKKNHYPEVSLVVEEITQAMESAADIIEKYPEQAKKIAGGITKAVKKYLNSDYTSDDGITLYNELMDVLEETGAEKEPYPQKEPGIDY